MNNLLRKTLIKTALFLGVIIAILGGLLYRKHVYIIPFPYEVAETPTKIYRDSLKQAQEAQVLIVGDRMGVALNSYIPMIKSELEKELKTAPAIYNWSRPHEGLHRTLNKIKSLKKVPPIFKVMKMKKLYHSLLLFQISQDGFIKMSTFNI
jgi:hypothetical protein